MTHMRRLQSKSGYYHVVPKGMHDQIIFEDDLDRRLYLELLRKAKDLFDITLHAYCLMSNHAHLVIEDPCGNLSTFMKYVDERYAMHFAKVRGRRGGVFVKPFWCEAINDDRRLLCAVRYVHANPAAAGICSASVYEWSSAKDFLGRDGIADTRMVLDMLGGREGFIAWSKASNSTAWPFPGSKLRGHLSDEELSRIVSAVLDRRDINLSAVPPEERKVMVHELLARGIPSRQLSRVVGLDRNEIMRCR